MKNLFLENDLFGGVPKDELEQLNIQIDECRFDDGEVVFDESEVGEHLYLVASGSVIISKRGRGGKQEVLTVKKPGDFFGEMALLLEDHIRSARATAQGSTVLGRMKREGLHALLGYSSNSALHFTRLITTQLRSASSLFIQELLNSERLSLIGTMMGSVVHDFRNPIGTILMISDYLLSKKDDARMVELGSLAGDAVDQMLSMIQELLDFSKGSIRVDLQPTTVADLLKTVDEQMLNILPPSGITVVRQIDYAGQITLDRNRAIRLFCNIIKNAGEAMSESGTLTIKSRKEGDKVNFVIEDTGCGIPADVLTRIFDPFVSHGKSSGTGLGMSIAKSVVEAHKGDIRIESWEGKGTRCHIVLPIAPAKVISGN